MSADGAWSWNDVPSKISNCDGRVVMISDRSGCGIILLEGSKPCFCFFHADSVLQSSGDRFSLSSWIPVGSLVRVYARKEGSLNHVPYMATSVSFKIGSSGNFDPSCNFKSIDSKTWQLYSRHCEELVSDISREDMDRVMSRFKGSSSYDRERSSHDRDDRQRQHDRQYNSRNEDDHNRYKERNSEDRDGYYSQRRHEQSSRGGGDRYSGERSYKDVGLRKNYENDFQQRSHSREKERYRRSSQDDNRYETQITHRRSSKDEEDRRYDNNKRRFDDIKENRGRGSGDDRYQDERRSGNRNSDHRDSQHHSRSDSYTSSSNHRYDRHDQDRKNKHHKANEHGQDSSSRSRHGSSTSSRPPASSDPVQRDDKPQASQGTNMDFYNMKSAKIFNPWRDQMSMLNSNSDSDAQKIDQAGGANHDVAENAAADSPEYHVSDDNDVPADGEDKEDPPAEPPKAKRARTPLQDDTDMKSRVKRRRFKSPERDNPGPQAVDSYPVVPSHKLWKTVTPEEIESSRFHEVSSGEEGVAVVVTEWSTQLSGVLNCSRNGHDIVFHTNQIIEKLSHGYWSPAREIYSSAEIKARFGVGAKLRCMYRKFDTGDHKYQATVVWREGATPKGFRTSEYLKDLDKVGSIIKEKRTSTASLFSKVRDGIVHEYISHETGLVRLLDDDQCVAVFSLDQVWDRTESGRSDFLINTDTTSLMSYLPIGSLVKITVRGIPHSPCTQMRYQAVLMWKPELGSSLPQEFSNRTSTRQARVEMSMFLDEVHDRIKHQLALGPVNTREHHYPVIVPVCLNLLPKEGSAQVVQPQATDPKHMGLVRVKISQFSDPSRQLCLYAMFHVEDVYDEDGKKWTEKNPEAKVADLKNAEVDLICRSVAKGDSYSEIKGLHDRIEAGKEYENATIPLLQATAVFLRGAQGKDVMTGGAPLPTFFRMEPSNLNRRQLCTAFYFNMKLKLELETKVYEYINGSNNLMRNHMRKLLHPRFFDSKEINAFRSNGPKYVLNRLGAVDIHRDIKHDYGSFNPQNIESCSSGNFPKKILNQSASLKVLWFDRPSPKYGLVKVEPSEGMQPVFAFFSKRVLNTKKYFSCFSDILWKNMKYLMVNAELVDSAGKIPYVVTEMWVIGDKKYGFPAVSDASLDWKKVVPAMLSDQYTLNFRASQQEENNFQKRLEQDERASERASQEEEKEGTLDSKVAASVEEQTEWLPSMKNVVCNVERVLGANYALAFGFQTFVGNVPKRYFALFDLCDVSIDGEPAIKSIKTLKDILEPGTKVRMNAVHYDTENPWNLRYIATAVVAGGKTCSQTEKPQPPPPLPDDAPCLDSSEGLKPDKIQNFKVVSGKIIKKPAPPVPEPVIAASTENTASTSKTKEMYNNTENHYSVKDRTDRRKDFKSSQSVVDRQRTLADVDMRNAVKRDDIIKNKPEVYAELKLMEINRGRNFFYDCKACGIQGMPIDDAEDHLKSTEHQENKARRAAQLNRYASKPGAGKSRFEDRSDAEEALFLNMNKGVTVELRNETKWFSCAECQASRMSFISAKKHVLSQAHKKRDKNRADNTAMEAESRDMRLVTKNGICYFCQPCAFKSENLAGIKKHLEEQDHKRKAVLFCHVCKEFQRDKNQLSDHRFSISHKRKTRELEEECANPTKKKKRMEEKPPPPKKPDSTAAAKEQASVPSSAGETEPGYNCKFCNFHTTDRNEERNHEATASHKRRMFLHTQQMPTEGVDAFKLTGERCDTIKEMCLIREGKDIEERAAREKSIRTSQEIKDAQESLLNKMFDAGILTQLDKKTSVRCNTCRTILNGKEKQLTRQLLAHLLGDKHRDKLRVQIKAEENTGIDRNTAQQQEDEENARAAAEAAAAEEEDRENQEQQSEQTPAAVEPVPDLDASEDDIVVYLKKQPDVVSLFSDQLFMCMCCRTALKHARDILQHLTSSAHEDKITPSREWRQYVDLIDAFEHGENMFKCLSCDTGLLLRSELELHLGMTEHLHRNVDEEKDAKIEKSLPIKLPTCDTCQTCLLSELDLRTHERHKHKKDYGFSADQVENLKSLSQSRNLEFEPSMMSVRGRVLQILPLSDIGIVQVPRTDNQYINVLFDISRVEMPDKKRSLIDCIKVGYPVLVNCVEMEPAVAGYSANINYYATAVTLVDEDEHSLMPMSFSSLQSDIGGTIMEAQKLSRDSLNVQLDLHAKGNQTPLFHTYPDMLENEGCLVVMKNQSCVLFKSLEKGVYGIQILESVLITEDSYETSTETFEVGNVVFTNCALMDPSLPAQYLVTGCWSICTREPVPRESLSLSAVDMYQTLARSYCMHPDMYPLLDLSTVLVPEQFGAIGFDDIAADGDLTDTSLLANGDDNADAELSAADENKDEALGFKKIKLGF